MRRGAVPQEAPSLTDDKHGHGSGHATLGGPSALAGTPASRLWQDSLNLLQRQATAQLQPVQAHVQAGVRQGKEAVADTNALDAVFASGGGFGGGAPAAVSPGAAASPAGAAADVDGMSADELRALTVRLKRALKRERDGGDALRSERRDVLSFLAEAGIIGAGDGAGGGAAAPAPLLPPPPRAAGPPALAVGALRSSMLRLEWASFLRRMGRAEEAERAEAAAAAAAAAERLPGGAADGDAAPVLSLAPVSISASEAGGAGSAALEAALEAAVAARNKERSDKDAIMEKTRAVIDKFKALQA